MKKFAAWAVATAGMLLISSVVYFFGFSVGVLRSPVRKSAAQSHPIAAFLARHWVYPLPPEGNPPRAYSALEASLSPQSCGQCHRQQYDDWRTSLHSRTVGPGLLWQLPLMDQQSANRCMRCHAPLAEQKALAALEFHWPNRPSSPPPAYVGPLLFHQGLVCAACHVRRHRRFGPPPPPGMPPGNTPGLPHGGFTVSAAFQHSRFCATCHQSSPGGRSLDGKPFENTYAEWRVSRFAREGVTCQSCHMPHRRHLWRGIHDPAMTVRALTVALDLTTLDREHMWAKAKIANTGAGHDFPTYVVPEVVFTLQLIDPHGRSKGEIARTVVARRVNVDLTQEKFDTRIRSGESRVLGGQFRRPAGPGWSVELRMAVSPGAHYIRVFQYALLHVTGLTSESRQLLRNALMQVKAARYNVTLVRKFIH
ncbi:MAG: multiheme c-type cytochrome [Acidiferrobacterales bacterium]